MTIMAVLFDLDNTLIDFVKMKKFATKAAARAMVKAGLKMSVNKAAKKLLESYYEHGIESDDAFTKFLEKNFGKVDERILDVGVNAYLKEKQKHLKPYPDVKRTLSTLKKRGIKLGIVSDAPKIKAVKRLKAMGLHKYFDSIVCFDDTGKKKPSKEPFLKALKELKVKPEEAMMVGDWPERDIEGAKAVGMRTCFARYGDFNGSKKSGADWEIGDIKEVLSVIK